MAGTLHLDTKGGSLMSTTAPRLRSTRRVMHWILVLTSLNISLSTKIFVASRRGPHLAMSAAITLPSLGCLTNRYSMLALCHTMYLELTAAQIVTCNIQL